MAEASFGEGSSIGEGGRRDPAAKGTDAFRELAGFLFGKNAKQQKMSMTTPVLTDTTGAMQFVLPADMKVRTTHMAVPSLSTQCMYCVAPHVPARVTLTAQGPAGCQHACHQAPSPGKLALRCCPEPKAVLGGAACSSRLPPPWTTIAGRAGQNSSAGLFCRPAHVATTSLVAHAAHQWAAKRQW